MPLALTSTERCAPARRIGSLPGGRRCGERQKNARRFLGTPTGPYKAEQYCQPRARRRIAARRMASLTSARLSSERPRSAKSPNGQAGDLGHVYKAHEPGRPARCGFGGPPAEIIAEVVAGVARDDDRQASCPDCHEEPLRWRAQRHRWRGSGTNGAEGGNITPHIGKRARNRVACPRFDAHVIAARRHSEHDQHVGPFACEQYRQFAINGIVAHPKYMCDATDIGEGGMAPSCHSSASTPVGCEGCAGKRAEPRDQDAEAHGQIVSVICRAPRRSPRLLRPRTCVLPPRQPRA